MPLRVVCMMQYLTVWEGVEKRSEDYASLMVVKAVKGRRPGGRNTAITYQNKSYTFGPSKPGPAIELWADWAAAKLQNIIQNGSIILVPVPNSMAVHGGSPNFPTAESARHIAEIVGRRVMVATELWWDQKMTPANEGGPRFAHQLYPHLVAERSALAGPRVLLDDVLTSGGHLRACAAKLREMGHNPNNAICCGRTVHEQLENPFDVPVEELSDFDPSDPYGFRDLFLEDLD